MEILLRETMKYEWPSLQEQRNATFPSIFEDQSESGQKKSLQELLSNWVIQSEGSIPKQEENQVEYDPLEDSDTPKPVHKESNSIDVSFEMASSQKVLSELANIAETQEENSMTYFRLDKEKLFSYLDGIFT